MSDTDTDAYCHTNCDSYTDTDGHADRHSDADADRHAYAHTDADRDGNSHAIGRGVVQGSYLAMIDSGAWRGKLSAGRVSAPAGGCGSVSRVGRSSAGGVESWEMAAMRAERSVRVISFQ